jgi:hypothetical protein
MGYPAATTVAGIRINAVRLIESFLKSLSSMLKLMPRIVRRYSDG